MPTVEIPIAASADDRYVYKDSGAYPPAGSVILNTSATSVVIQRSLGATYRVACGLMRFSSDGYLPDDCTIVSAWVRCVPTYRDNVNAKSLAMDYWLLANTDADYSATPLDNAHAGTPLANLTLNVDNSFALLNPDANVSKTSDTGLRLHLGDDTVPTGSNQLNIASYDHATLTEPRLVVEYTLNAPPAPPTGLTATVGTSSD